MGKRLRTQRRGKGSVYKSPSHRHIGEVGYPNIKKGSGTVMDLLHDPGHTVPIAKIRLGGENPRNYYMFAANSLRVDQVVQIGEHGPIDIGNTYQIGNIPEGTMVFNIESQPGDGGKFVRAGGTSATVVGHGEKTVVQMPSGKFKYFNRRCRATIGILAGGGRKDKPFAKAGKKVHTYQSKAKKAIRVSGVAMNPVNHPHGGGAHQHVGTQSTVSRHAPPGRKVGRLSPKKKVKKKKRGK